MKIFHCGQCSQRVFFENVKCEQCFALLGYLPDFGEVGAFEPVGDGIWRSLHPAALGKHYRQCNNYALEQVCNWMIPAESDDVLCRSCVLTETIPNLSSPDNRLLWRRLEAAKRRLLYTLLVLGLPVESYAQQPSYGMRFDFKESTHIEAVMTGHADGLITINLSEADDAMREQIRVEMHEPYRTLLGHFRHEIGHYYFDRLVSNTSWIDAFRACFGDERVDYQTALHAHYANGVSSGWESTYVSEYAAMHPWEDWAETWAHYLHIVDTLDTATACELVLAPDHVNLPELSDHTAVTEASFDNLMQRWFSLTYVLNSLNRSMGMQDAYPFVLAPTVITKLRFVHDVIESNQMIAPEPSLVAYAAGGGR